jgi:hypothetical protein
MDLRVAPRSFQVERALFVKARLCNDSRSERIEAVQFLVCQVMAWFIAQHGVEEGRKKGCLSSGFGMLRSMDGG